MKGGTAKSDASAKKDRKPSAYNQYMAKHLPLYKAQHPDNNHKDNFAAVAAQWKTDPSNPKNSSDAATEPDMPSLVGTAESLIPEEKKKKKKKKKSACDLGRVSRLRRCR